MKVRFTKRVQVRRGDRQGRVFDKDSVHDLPNASANHWIVREAAVEVKSETSVRPPRVDPDADAKARALAKAKAEADAKAAKVKAEADAKAAKAKAEADAKDEK